MIFPDPLSIFLASLINPLVIVVSFLMGRKADQGAKIIFAGFAGAAAGLLLSLALAHFSVAPFATAFRAIGGLFIVHLLFGMVWAGAGFLLARRKRGG
ncbi:MAG: hypothetical protein KDJ41_06510 [Hyphomicrobiaceae bacterium]|nr:hypothetical protein [Hyphomicrobiaceae bacterium]